MRLKIIFLFSLGIFITAFFVYLFLNSSSKQQLSAPQTIPFDKDYSALNKTFPGKSTMDDVKKINDAPDKTENKNGKIYFYYKTPSSDFKNVVVFNNGVEEYAIENIFGSYRGNYDSFVKVYGQGVAAYDKDFPYIWQVFPDSGIGIETNTIDVIKIIYFVPQNEESFFSGVGKEVGLTKNKPSPEALYR